MTATPTPPTYEEWQEHRACTRKTRRYDTQLDANTAVLHLWKKGRRARAYRCQFCDGFHLTSHPAKEQTP